jgi:hypothetical protein
MEEEVLCCGGALLVTLIYFEFKAHNQHGYHSILQPYAITSGLRLVGSFVFNRTMTQHTSRLCNVYLTKKERDGVLHQITWPPQLPDLNPSEMAWDELDRSVKEKQPTSA